jgi:hypothetical protein
MGESSDRDVSVTEPTGMPLVLPALIAAAVHEARMKTKSPPIARRAEFIQVSLELEPELSLQRAWIFSALCCDLAKWCR